MTASVTSSLFGSPVIVGRWLVRVGGAVFRFDEYGWEDRPARTGCVYGFARIRSNRIEHLYIGRAADLPGRLADHETLAAARALGANRLLVHTPGFASRIPAADAEHLLVAALKPPLNDGGVPAVRGEARLGIG